ncbi:MAG: ABC transporter ATP-binding protein, partial [Alphaproteobacteria bacterium]|nr:ABC transporter ATP-binding protein [Alphaproteobacteria bacterium]
MAAPLLAVDGLTIEFGARDRAVRAVNDVRFEIPSGGAVGLVGES